LRAWTIGEGLRRLGLQVDYAVRTAWRNALEPLPLARSYERYFESGPQLAEIAARIAPDVLVNCSYPSLFSGGVGGAVVVQDVNGPRLLEGGFRDRTSLLRAAWREATAYAGADYFVCGGERQLAFYYPWLALSGFDVTSRERIAAVRAALPDPPKPPRPAGGLLVGSAVSLPWVDARRLWRLAMEEARRAGGRLRVFTDGAASPAADFAEGEARPRAAWGDFPRDLAEASAAFDMSERNAERELAVPTRTLIYLWAGLPPILPDFGELGELVARYDAGWSLPPEDEGAVRAAVREAVTDSAAVARKSENARRLYRERLAPEVSLARLAAFCREGTRRPGRASLPGRARRRLAERALGLARGLSGLVPGAGTPE
jgi:hypothetical protein